MTDIITLPDIEPIDFEILIRAMQYYKRSLKSGTFEREHIIGLMQYFVSGKIIQ